MTNPDAHDMNQVRDRCVFAMHRASRTFTTEPVRRCPERLVSAPAHRGMRWWHMERLTLGCMLVVLSLVAGMPGATYATESEGPCPDWGQSRLLAPEHLGGGSALPRRRRRRRHSWQMGRNATAIRGIVATRGDGEAPARRRRQSRGAGRERGTPAAPRGNQPRQGGGKPSARRRSRGRWGGRARQSNPAALGRSRGQLSKPRAILLAAGAQLETRETGTAGFSSPPRRGVWRGGGDEVSSLRRRQTRRAGRQPWWDSCFTQRRSGDGRGGSGRSKASRRSCASCSPPGLPSMRGTTHGQTPLRVAAACRQRNGGEGTSRRRSGRSEARDESGHTPLHAAAMKDDPEELAEEFLDEVAGAERTGDSERTARRRSRRRCAGREGRDTLARRRRIRQRGNDACSPRRGCHGGGSG